MTLEQAIEKVREMRDMYLDSEEGYRDCDNTFAAFQQAQASIHELEETVSTLEAERQQDKSTITAQAAEIEQIRAVVETGANASAKYTLVLGRQEND